MAPCPDRRGSARLAAAAAAATASAGQPGALGPGVLCLVHGWAAQPDQFHFFLPGGPHSRPRPTGGRKAGAAAEGRTNAAAALHHPSLL